MKLAFISDLHFGYSDDSLPQAKKALELALARGAQAIVMPGDLFDARIPRQETVLEAVGLFKEILANSANPLSIVSHDGPDPVPLAWRGIPLLAIPGTHERRSKGMVNVIQILDAAGILINLHGRKLVLEREGERVALQGMQGVPEDYLRAILQASSLAPMPNAFNIFVFHQSLSELLPFEHEDFVSLQELPAGFDLYLDGHIHWNVEIREKGRHLLVPGSTVITQMRKREEQGKGFLLFDTSTRSSEFVELGSRPFFLHELKFESATPVHVAQALEKALQSVVALSLPQMPQVRVVLSGTLAPGISPSALDVDALLARYSSRMRLHVEKEFESKELKDKVALLRKLRSEKKGAREWGAELLHTRLKENGADFADADSFFELLAEGELEQAEALL